MNAGWLDNAYFLTHHCVPFRSPYFFSCGWGNLAVCETVKQRLVQTSLAADVCVNWDEPWRVHDGVRYRDGRFETPCYRDWLPLVARTCHFRFVLPLVPEVPPVYVHLATTGEEGYATREQCMARPLAQQGIGTLMLEHAFLGRRRPAWQASNKLEQVADLLLLGGSVVEEARALLVWLRHQGFDRLGITGISMGGHLAALAAVLTPFDIAIVPLVAPHSGVPVFTEGLLSRQCDWSMLRDRPFAEQSARLKLRDLLAFTDVQSLPPPRSGCRIVALAARHDSFVPRHSSESLQQHWPNAEFRWMNGGHVSNIVFNKSMFRKAMLDAIDG